MKRDMERARGHDHDKAFRNTAIVSLRDNSVAITIKESMSAEENSSRPHSDFSTSLARRGLG